MENISKSQFKKIKDPVVDKIKDDLVKTGRSIIGGLGTFKVVQHKAKINNLGKIPARKLVKFSATADLRKLVNTKKR